MLTDETSILTNRIKYFLGHVETVDENYIVTFSIPDTLENLSTYPTAYPKSTDHIREVKKGDSILVEQLDSTTQFFMYTPINKNNKTGIYFGKIRVDISDGDKITICSDNTKIEFNSNGDMFIGNDKYSLNQFIVDFGIAMAQLRTEGSPYMQYGSSWASSTLQPVLNKLAKLFPTPYV